MNNSFNFRFLVILTLSFMSYSCTKDETSAMLLNQKEKREQIETIARKYGVKVTFTSNEIDDPMDPTNDLVKFDSLLRELTATRHYCCRGNISKSGSVFQFRSNAVGNSPRIKLKSEQAGSVHGFKPANLAQDRNESVYVNISLSWSGVTDNGELTTFITGAYPSGVSYIPKSKFTYRLNKRSIEFSSTGVYRYPLSSGKVMEFTIISNGTVDVVENKAEWTVSTPDYKI